jgi:hypothetical protein
VINLFLVSGRIGGAICRDLIHDEIIEIHADMVVNVDDEMWDQKLRIAQEATSALPELDRPTSRFKRWLRRS